MPIVTRVYTVRGDGFGPGVSGVGYTLNPGGTRTTTGVSQVGPLGGYQALVSHPAEFVGLVYWDNGLEGDAYHDAWEEVNPSVSVQPAAPAPTPAVLPDGLAPSPDAVAGRLAAAIAGPAEVSGEAGSARQQPIPDLIAAHRYAAAVAASKSPRQGLRFTKLLPGGTVGRSATGDPRNTITPPTFDRV